MTVCDREWVKFLKSSVHIRYGQPLIAKDYIYTITIINVQQTLVVSFRLVRPAVHDYVLCGPRGQKGWTALG